MEELLASVVIPVYNEGPNIEPVLRDVSRFVPRPHEVLVLYDLETDDTLPVVRRLQSEQPGLRLVRNTHGRGALNALRTGFSAARGRYVLVTMGDRSDDLRDVPAMVAAADRGAAVVAASRYMPGGRQLGGSGLQALLSKLAGLSLHHIGGLPIHDPTSNFKLYARSFLASVEIESRAGFEVALELSVKAYRRGLALAEVPTTWRGRRAGRSRFALWSWLPHYLRWYARGMLGRFTLRSKSARLQASRRVDPAGGRGLDLDALYDARFDATARRRKDAVWAEICRYLQRFVPPTSSVLDVGCDEGYFIRHIVAFERWATDVRDMRASLPADVVFIQADLVTLLARVPRRFDRVFMSNILEHLRDVDEVVAMLRTCHDLLAPDGRLIVLQPNIRLVGHAYWDFLDHRVPLTELSLDEGMRLAGLRTEHVITRFLPYTTKSRLPTHPLLVRAYLALPPLWWAFGKQTLLVARAS